ncbi:hypothetical protein H113_03974 [Trichophyton rubrum MR1459]|uniref:non-specific serine/threonine protein kinase n=1 Tax=Trichophyton rubrum (strain ATCC MYA-4607 / CBS 118892) TaxID=559305 RepID=A0A080WJZ7_TRIRC|nr:uncharacterized protein TERG_12259 [Trichophyton rubrum CBS 118892]EZF95686.1 hypothetical protein H113_03974 [Trichophyton rubrum MR1459]EZG06611.1 hypothetical protein H106_03759 [Trichophyton rubrum CBS 735.88]KFL61904.1 hypothetical protein TERG_12259 [Trichophyton rubrum CBS 118892]
MVVERLFGLLKTFTGVAPTTLAFNLNILTPPRWRWLEEKYVAVKINSNHDTRKFSGDSEINILRHISTANPRHIGWHFTRHLLDTFLVQNPTSKKPHACLVFEPLRESLGRYCRRWEDGVMPPEIFRIVLQIILQALDYLHSECHIIHTGRHFARCIAREIY